MDSALTIKEIIFSVDGLKTDAMLYRERCNMLIPEPFTQNIFYAVTGKSGARVFVASDSHVNMNRMLTFFSKMYNATPVEFMPLEKNFSSHYVLKFRTSVLVEKEFYYPGFIRNLFDYGSIDGETVVRYAVAMRSGISKLARKRTFGVSITLSFDSESTRNRIMPLISSELRNFRKENKVKLKRMWWKRMRDTSHDVPFNLINFIRIPSDSDLT